MPLLACGRATAEADDVAIGILNIEVFGAPRSSRERLDDRCTIGDALPVERFDAVDARRGVEMLVIAPVPALRLVLGRFLQVKLHSVQMTDSVETIPRLTEREAELLVIRDRALKI